MKVSSFMTKKVVTVGLDTLAAQAYMMMEDNHFRHLPVVGSNNELCGIISRSDLREGLRLKDTDLKLSPEHFLNEAKVQSLCSKRPLSVSVDSDIRQAAHIMVKRKIGALPVVDASNKIVGIITETDILSTFVQLMGYVSDSNEICLNMPDSKVSFNKALDVLKKEGVEVLSISMSKSSRKGRKDYSFRVQTGDIGKVRERLTKKGYEIVNFV